MNIKNLSFMITICAALIAALLLTSCGAPDKGAASDSESESVSVPESESFSIAPGQTLPDYTSASAESAGDGEVTAYEPIIIDGTGGGKGAAELYIYYYTSTEYYWAQSEPIDLKKADNISEGGKYICANADASLIMSLKTKLVISDGGTLICDAKSGEIIRPELPEKAVYITNSGTSLLYSDGDVLICDAESGGVRRLDLSAEDYPNITFNRDRNTEEITGLSLYDKNNKAAFYSLADESFKTGFIHGEISYFTCGNRFFATDFIKDEADPNYESGISYVYTIDTGSLVGSANGYISFISGDEKQYYLLNESPASSTYFKVYNSDMKLLSDDKFFQATVTKDGSLLLIGYDHGGGDRAQADHFIILGQDGSLICTSRDYDDVFYVWSDYICVNDGGMLTLLDREENTVAVLKEWNDKMYFHWMISGYQKKTNDIKYYDALSYYKIKNGNGKPIYEKQPLPDKFSAGLYFICEDSAIEYGTEGSGMEFIFDPVTGEISMFTTIGVGAYAKPVLYLYPEAECEVSVRFAHPEYLTVTYPDYGDGWSVTASPDGALSDGGGRGYYALYWEEVGYTSVDFSTGFCVKGEDAAPFLEEKLDALGFTEREANEFIMYWLPILKRNGLSLVYFELTESRQQYNALEITPRPDSLLRVAIHIKKIAAPAEIEPQTLPRFERSGFAAIEWGGRIY